MSRPGDGPEPPLPKFLAALAMAAEVSSDRVFRLRRRVDYFRRVAHIFTDMKLTEARLATVRDPGARDREWDIVHKRSADRMVDLALTLRGFYVKAAQLLSTRQDFVPLSMTTKLAQMQDDVPPMAAAEAKQIVERELARACDAEFEASRRERRGVRLKHCRVFGEGAQRIPVEAVFEDGIDFEVPVGSASLACVYRARLKHSGKDVAVKVQNPAARLVAGDVDSLVAVGKVLEKTDLKINFTAFLAEIRNQVSKELDFGFEGTTMNSVRANLLGVKNVSVPRAFTELGTNRLLIMEFLPGKSLNVLKKEAKLADQPEWKRKAFGAQLLDLMAKSWGQMIFGTGLFHGDAHPGNLLIDIRRRQFLGNMLPPTVNLGIIDLGQAKQLTPEAQTRLARLVVALAEANPEGGGIDDVRVASAFRSTGLQFEKMNDNAFLAVAARTLFSTEMVGGKPFNPFGKDSILAENGIQNIPSDLVFVIRVIQMTRGVSTALGCPEFSLATEWKTAAEDFLGRRKVYRKKLKADVD